MDISKQFRTTFETINTMNKSSSMYTRDQYNYLIYISENCNKFEDSLNSFENMIENYPSALNITERDMLENCVKSLIKIKQKNLNKIYSLIKEVQKQKETEVSEEEILILNSLYDEKLFVESEIIGICKKVIKIIDNILLKITSKSEKTVNPYMEKECEIFLLRLKGDMNKYLSQTDNQSEFDLYLTRANDYFKEAYELAKKYLDGGNKTFLETSLFYSKFLIDFMKNCEDALEILIATYDSQQLKEVIESRDEGIMELINEIKTLIIELKC